MILTAKSIRERSLLGLKGLAASEIESILDRAAHWDKQEEKLVPVLASKFVANMFF